MYSSIRPRQTYGFSLDEFWILSTIMAACCGVDTILNEATETTIVIRKLFIENNGRDTNEEEETSKWSQSIALTSGVVGAVNEITENTTTVLVTLNISSMCSKYGVLAGVVFGVGCPNAIFKGGISRDACEAGVSLFKQRALLKQPKRLMVAIETLLFSLLLGESLRNLFLNLMEENSLPFEVPPPLIHVLAILIALRGAGNAVYCSYPFFSSLTNIVANGFIEGCHSIGSGVTKIQKWGAKFFDNSQERRPLLEYVTNFSKNEKQDVSIQVQI